jgi:outer membrane protein TolC
MEEKKMIGPSGMDEIHAIKTGLDHRLDLRVSEGKVFDAQRAVVVKADALRAELTLLGKAQYGESRSLATVYQDDAELRTDKGIYTGLFNLDLPFERRAERNAYRNSYINLERAVRDFQKMEDDVKLSIRDCLRRMEEATEGLRIQTMAVSVAEKRVRSADMFFEAGRAELRDLLDAQEALLTAKNALTAAMVDYRMAELEFQRDTGLLTIDEKGLFQEYNPGGKINDKKS